MTAAPTPDEVIQKQKADIRRFLQRITTLEVAIKQIAVRLRSHGLDNTAKELEDLFNAKW